MNIISGKVVKMIKSDKYIRSIECVTTVNPAKMDETINPIFLFLSENNNQVINKIMIK
jgi:hypothetical protein